jgi:hypothetical protein
MRLINHAMGLRFAGLSLLCTAALASCGMLRNSELQYAAARCASDEFHSCKMLSDSYMAKLKTENHYAVDTKMRDAYCKGQTTISSCDKPPQAPAMLERDAFPSAKRDKILNLIDSACEEGSARACIEAAYIVSNQHGTFQPIVQSPDFDLALTYSMRACGLGGMRGCNEVANYFHGNYLNSHRPNGIGAPPQSVIAARRDRADKYLTKKCEKDIGWACGALGKAITGARLGALQAPMEHPEVLRGLDYLERGCNLQDIGSCERLVRLYEGKGDFEANLDLSMNYLERGCSYNDVRACAEISLHYKRAGETDAAEEWKQRACQIGERMPRMISTRRGKLECTPAPAK